MGKSKRRTLHKGKNNQITNLRREDALNDVVLACNKKNVNDEAKDLISLFCFSAEELLEGGASYEDVLGLMPILHNPSL